MKKILFIINPKAGKTRSRSSLFDAAAIFSEAGALVRIRLTKKQGDARCFAAEEAADYDLVVCAGGDGTFNETVSGLMEVENHPPVGYLPCGSTNDFATSLKLADNPALSARRIIEGKAQALDLGTHNGRYFAYVASFGAFTRSSYSAPQHTKNALGHLAYILEGVKDLDSLRPYRCRVEADGEVFEGDFIFGAVCNSTSLGGLIRLNPNSVHLNDGSFELLLLRTPRNPLDFQNLLLAMTKMQYDYPGVIFRHVKHVVVTTEEEIPWSLDGEYAPSAPRVEIQNLPSALTLVL